MEDIAQMRELKIITGLRPKQVDIGTQMKLLKPRTRMAMPRIRVSLIRGLAGGKFAPVN